MDFYLKISTSLAQHKQHGGHHPTSFGLNLNDVATSQGFIIRAMHHLREQTYIKIGIKKKKTKKKKKIGIIFFSQR
jgi:hypothetical protein